MNRSLLLVALLPCVITCDSGEVALPKGQLAIEVASLSLPEIVDASYRITVADEQHDIVWSGTASSARYGDGAGSLSYVGTCVEGPSTVTLEVLSLSDGEGLLGADEWVSPPPIVQHVACVANQDVRVDFDITLARPARQGFFDIGVTFDDIFCSAKLDCGPAEEDLLLLHDDGGARGMTAVLALACTAAPDGTGDTRLYLDDLTIDCEPGADATVAVDGLGDVDLSLPPSSDPGGYLFAAAVYRGIEAQDDVHYWNVALGLDEAQFASAGRCVLHATATASDGPLSDDPLATPVGIYPVIAWDVALSDASGRLCTQHPLDGGDVPDVGGVDTTYPVGPVTFDHGHDGEAPVLPQALVGAHLEAAPEEHVTLAATTTREGYAFLRKEGAAGPMVIPAGAGLATITNANPSCVSAPAYVALTAGMTEVPFTITAVAYSACSTTLTVSHPQLGADVIELSVEPVALAFSRTSASAIANVGIAVDLQLAWGSATIGLPIDAAPVSFTTSDAACVAAPAPTVLAGQTSAPFTFTAGATTFPCSATITASHPRLGTTSVALTFDPIARLFVRGPASLTLDPAASANVTLVLEEEGTELVKPAPNNPGVYALVSSDPSCVTVPATVPLTVGAMAHTATFATSSLVGCSAAVTVSSARFGATTIAVSVRQGHLEIEHAAVTQWSDRHATNRVYLAGDDGPIGAPVGAGALDLTSSNAACGTVSGAFADNASSAVLDLVPGVGPFPCDTTVTVHSAWFGDTGFALSFNPLPTLAFLESSLQVQVSHAATLTIVPLASGVPGNFPAPSDILDVNVADPTCLTAPATVQYLGGALSVTLHVTAGATPCTTTLTVAHSEYGSATIPVEVAPLPDLGPLTIANDAEGKVGAGLQEQFTVAIGTASHSAIDVVITSSDPRTVRLAASSDAVGTASITVQIVNGVAQKTFYVQGMPGALGAVTLDATNIRCDSGSATVTSVRPVFELFDLLLARSVSTASTNVDDVFEARVGVALANGSRKAQNVSSGSAPLNVTFTVSGNGSAKIAKSAGAAQSTSVALGAFTSGTAVGLGAGGVALRLQTNPTAGTYTVSASSADSDSGFALSSANVVVTVATATLTITESNALYRVGAGLQMAYSLALSSPHAAGTARIAVSDATLATVASAVGNNGTTFIDVPFVASDTLKTFYVQGAASGTVSLRATAPLFVDGDRNVAIVTPVLEITGIATTYYGPPSTYNEYSNFADESFVVETGVLALDGTTRVAQALAAGSPTLTVTVAKTASAAATLISNSGSGDAQTMTIAAQSSKSPNGKSAGGVSIDYALPAASGSFVLSASAPGFGTFSGSSKAIQLSIYNTKIKTYENPASGGDVVGAGMRLAYSYELYNETVLSSASNHGGATFKITSSDPTKLLIATSTTNLGAASVSQSISNGNPGSSYYVYGVPGASGVVNVTIECASPSTCYFDPIVKPVTVKPIFPSIGGNGNATTTTLKAAANQELYVALYTTSSTGTLIQQKIANWSTPFKVTLTLSGPPTASLYSTEGGQTGESVTYTVANNYDTTGYQTSFRFVPDAYQPAGSNVYYLDASVPGSAAGGNSHRQITITSNQATTSIVVNGAAAGYTAIGMDSGVVSARVSENGHSGVTMTISVDRPELAQLSLAQNGTLASTLVIPFAAGTTSVSFYVRGVAVGAATISVAVDHATSSTSAVTVTEPGVRYLYQSAGTNWANGGTYTGQTGYLGYVIGPYVGGVIQSVGTLPTVAGSMTVTLTSNTPSVCQIQSAGGTVATVYPMLLTSGSSGIPIPYATYGFRMVKATSAGACQIATTISTGALGQTLSFTMN